MSGLYKMRVLKRVDAVKNMLFVAIWKYKHILSENICVLSIYQRISMEN